MSYHWLVSLSMKLILLILLSLEMR